MRSAMIAAAVVIAIVQSSTGAAEARHHRHHHYHHHRVHHVAASHDPRPARWCGWWLRHYLGVADRRFNLARNWAGLGRPAAGPAPGVVAVWRHHVGVVTGVPGRGRIVLKSGNDSRAVRERERSTRGVIAWRWV